MNGALFLFVDYVSIGYHGGGEVVILKSITDTPDNVIDMHRVDFNILDNSCLILHRI